MRLNYNIMAIAVMLAAGLDGIERKLEPPIPAEEDLYQVDTTRAGFDTLPGSLGEALEAMKQDKVVQEALGQHVFERFIEAKTLEWDQYRIYVTQWELDRYLKIF